MATHYIDEAGYTPFDEIRYSISRYNNYLHDVISKIIEKHAGVNIVSPPSWMIYGDKNHLWGAHPYHYNKLLYLFSAQKYSMTECVHHGISPLRLGLNNIKIKK